MTNSKAQRDEILELAGYTHLPNGQWRHPANKPGKPNVCFTCKSCWRRSLQSDLNNLNCPFCGSAMYGGSKP